MKLRLLWRGAFGVIFFLSLLTICIWFAGTLLLRSSDRPDDETKSVSALGIRSIEPSGDEEDIPLESVMATRRMYAAHESLRDPRVDDPDSFENKAILEAMVFKALSLKENGEAR